MLEVEKMYEQYAQIVYKYIVCLTGQQDEAEEIVQDTFLVAIKSIDKFKQECKVSTWLCQIAKYIWYEKLRKEKRRKVIPLEEIENLAIMNNLMEDQICEKEDRLELLKSLQYFDEETKNVMYLRILGNFEYNEIAEIMNKTPNWARVVFFRGKQRLCKEEKKEND